MMKQKEKKTKEYNELPLYRQGTELVTLIEKFMAKTTRQYRYTFGERMVTAALALPMDFYHIFSMKTPEEKAEGIKVYIEHLAELKMLVDVGHQLGLFCYKDFPVLLERIDSVERQINGFNNANAKVLDMKGVR